MWTALWVGLLSATPASVQVGCQRVELMLPAGVNAERVDATWASGEPQLPSPASLVLHDCDGTEVDRLILEAAHARLDPSLVNGAVLVSVDLTREAGAFNGPMTVAVEILANHLHVVEALDVKGKKVPLRFAQTLRADFRRVGDSFLVVKSDATTTRFLRVFLSRGRWQVRERTERGLWESDGEFPELKRFP